MAMTPWIHDAIMCERVRQHEKWTRNHAWGNGDCSSRQVADPVKSMVLQEECGEVARAVLEGDREGLRNELTQVAAVAVAWLECMGESYQ